MELSYLRHVIAPYIMDINARESLFITLHIVNQVKRKLYVGNKSTLDLDMYTKVHCILSKYVNSTVVPSINIETQTSNTFVSTNLNQPTTW